MPVKIEKTEMKEFSIKFKHGCDFGQQIHSAIARRLGN